MTSTIHSLAMILFCCVAGFSATLSAAEVPDKSDVEALVQQLGDEQYSVRQKAAKELKEMGESVAEQLRIFRDDPDPERRMRVRGVLEDIAALRRELKWVDPKHLGERVYYSKTGRSVRLTFRNLTKKPVRIFWIELDGSHRAWRGLLKAGESAVCARSYIGHVWLITDADKKPLGMYSIDIEDPVIAVREQDIKK